MAKATAQNITRTVTDFDGVHLVLNVAESLALAAVLQHVAGPRDGPRGHVERISNAVYSQIPQELKQRFDALLAASSGVVTLEDGE